MNENKLTHYTKFMIRWGLALVCWLWLLATLWKLQDISILLKSILMIGLLGAMLLNIYNGRENRYNDFKQALSKLEKLDEGTFTYFIVRLYRTLGYYTKIALWRTSMHQGMRYEVILRKGAAAEEVILVHCYNKEIDFKAVQTLIGRLSGYKAPIKGQIITTKTVSEAVKQLADLNEITVIDGTGLQRYMKGASHSLEGELDNAFSAMLCHPVNWFYSHFLADEPRFMQSVTWQAWVSLTLKNRGYKVSKAESPEQYGVHFVAQKDEEKIAIWCLGRDKHLTSEMLQALKASLAYYEVPQGMVITNGKYGYKEKRFAKQLQVDILNFDAFNKYEKSSK